MRRASAVIIGLCSLLVLTVQGWTAPMDHKAGSRKPAMTLPLEQEFEIGGTKELERLCAEKTAVSLPLISVPTSALAR